MVNKIIVVDIDNTILSPNLRKQKIIQELFGKSIELDRINSDFSLNGILTEIADDIGCDANTVIHKFENEFFSYNYYDAEYFDVIDNSAQYLKELNQFANIVYLTSRDIQLKEITIEQLIIKGFPEPKGKNKIIFTSIEEDIELKNFENYSFKAKQKSLEKLLTTNQVCLSIGDRPSDAAAAYQNKIQSVVFSKQKEEEIIQQMLVYLNLDRNDFDEYGIICVDNWVDIYQCAKHSLGVCQDINKICNTHAADYSSWLNDLDQKSSLILVIATFCGTIFLNILLEESSYSSNIISILALLGHL